MTQESRRQSFEIIIINKKINKLVQVVKCISRNFFDFIVGQVQSLKLWHSREIISFDKLHSALSYKIFLQIWEENASIESWQVWNFTVLDPNIFNISIRFSIL